LKGLPILRSLNATYLLLNCGKMVVHVLQHLGFVLSESLRVPLPLAAAGSAAGSGRPGDTRHRQHHNRDRRKHIIFHGEIPQSIDSVWARGNWIITEPKQ
jgi:hypothetical protein